MLDAAGSERTAVFTYSLGGLVGAHLAAEHPRAGRRADHVRVARAHGSWAPDYDWALTSEEREQLTESNLAELGRAERSGDVAGSRPRWRGDPGAHRVVRPPAAAGREPR